MWTLPRGGTHIKQNSDGWESRSGIVAHYRLRCAILEGCDANPHAESEGSATQDASDLRWRMVWFWTSGRAQKPTPRIQPKVTYNSNRPARSPRWSPIWPIQSGTMAPPMIAVQRIPAKAPCE